MNYVEKLLDNFQSAIKINPSTFSGAVDIVVVQQDDGSFKSTPWHVRFGKIHLLNPTERKVYVYVNGERIKGIKMKLGSAGEAYFLHESPEGQPLKLSSSSVLPLNPTNSPYASDAEAETSKGDASSDSALSPDLAAKDSKDDDSTAAGSAERIGRSSLPQRSRSASLSSSPISGHSPADSPPVAGAHPQPLDSSHLTASTPATPAPQQSSSRWSWGWGATPKATGADANPQQTSRDDDALSHPPHERIVQHRPRSSSFDTGDIHVLRASSSHPDIQTSNSAESPNTTPIAQEPQLQAKESGSWSTSVGSWLALFKKSKKNNLADPTANSGTATPTVPAATNQDGEEDEYDRNLNMSDLAHANDAFALSKEEDEEDDDTQFSDAADQLDDSSPRKPAVPVTTGSVEEDDLPSRRSSAQDVTAPFEETEVTKRIEEMGTYNVGGDDGSIFLMDDEQQDGVSLSTRPIKAQSRNILVSSSGSTTGTNTPPRSPEKQRRAAVASSIGSGDAPPQVEPVIPELSPLREFNIEISKCGNIIFNPDYVGDDMKTAEAFKQNIVTYEMMSADPDLIFQPDMVFKVENKLYPWQVAAPFIVSLFAFQRRLDAQVMDQHYNKWKQANTKSSGSVWTRWLPRGWRRSETPPTPSKSEPGMQKSSSLVLPSAARTLEFSSAANKIIPDPVKGAASAPISPSPSAATLYPAEDEDDEESESGTDANGNKITYIKSLKPLPEQLAELKLQPGVNHIQFKVKGSKKGTYTEVTSNIYLWNKNVKIVVSDIDGTITKTDVFGQIFPVFGKDWSHIGVAELFSNIKANGYEILYLTARSIGAAKVTKEYLASLKQESGHSLPPGPVFMSPDRLLNALNREVILRKPEQFKIQCLSDIKAVFQDGSNPFYAGFGNRHTDAVSYVAVGIGKAKIFIINPQGEIECASKSVRRSYTKINELVEQMFPPYHIKVTAKAHTEEEWNDFNYWKDASSMQYSLEDLEASLKPSK